MSTNSKRNSDDEDTVFVHQIKILCRPKGTKDEFQVREFSICHERPDPWMYELKDKWNKQFGGTWEAKGDQ